MKERQDDNSKPSEEVRDRIWELAETIRLLTVTPQRGELWDSPGKAVALVKMVAAVVTGSPPKMGDNAKVDL